MNVTLEQIDDVNAKVIVTVDDADYADKVTTKLKQIGKTHQIPGFRKGHVDINQLRKRFGREVKSEVINEEVYRAVIKYIVDNKIEALGRPMPVEVKEINLEDKEYTFEYNIGLAPKLDITIDKSVEIPYYEIELTQEMVDQQDKNFRERFGAQVPGEEVDEKAIVKGPIMELNADGSIKEGEDAIQVTAGMVAPFLFKSKEEADKFIGKHKDEKVVFNPFNSCEGNEAELASMLGIDKDKAANTKGDFQLTISEIMVLKPAEHDQEFYNNIFGEGKVNNEEEYDKGIREMIQTQLENNSHSMFSRDAEKYLYEKYKDMQLPVEFLKNFIRANEEKVDEEHFEENANASLEQLKWTLINDKACVALGVKVEEEDVVAHANEIARSQFIQYGIYNIDEETIADSAKRILANEQYRQRITEEVQHMKLFTAMQEAVTLKKETVSLDKFREIAQA
jgi:trigger factor